MPRTTPAAVKAILIGDYDTVAEPTLVPFIATATVITTRVIACAARKGITYEACEAELIERWLAAHLYGMSDQPYASRSTLRASGTFQGQTGMYLEATKYGQMAVLLDVAGCLDNMGRNQTVKVGWGGKRPSNQTDYSDRD